MSEWKEVKLGDVCEFHYGKSLPATKRKKGNIPVYGSAGIIGYHNEALINSKGIIIGRKGTIGKVYKSYKPFFPIDTVFYVLPDDKKYNFEYMFYLLVSLNLDKLNEDSAVPGLNRNNAYNQQIKLPPLPIQKKIADILSVIDEKIETLQNINSTLEEMAKAIFKSWFVDFDIVKAKASGKSDSEIAKEFGISKEIVKLFPREFETSEIGKIPKGWEVGSFEQDCNIAYGKNLPKSKLKEKGYPVFGGNGIIGYYDKFLYEEPQVIIACRGAASGKVNITLPYSFVTNNSLIIEVKNQSLCFEYIKYLSVFTDFTTYVTGSAQPQITITSIKKHKFLLPSKIIMEEYSKIISNFEKIYLNNQYQIQTLQELKDTFLPKLIKGEIEVDRLDIRGINKNLV